MVAKRGPKPKEFSNEEKAQALAVLAEKEGNLKEAAKELNLTPYILKKLRNAYPELYEAARKQMVDDLYDKTIVMANRYADEILNRLDDPETLAGMKTEKLAVVYGISVDKTGVMTHIRSKFGEAQKKAEDFSQYTDEEMQKAIEGEFKEIQAEEPTDDESMSGPPKDKLPIRPSSVPTLGSFLHRSRDRGQA